MASARPAVIAALVVGACVLGPLVPSAVASSEAPGRFEVLQAAFFAFSQSGATHQPLAQRCVLLEDYIASAGSENALARQAAYAILNNTSRSQFVLAEHHPLGGEAADPLGTAYATDRFTLVYRVQVVPAAGFDGLFWEYRAGNSTRVNYESDYHAARERPAGASVNVSGAVVLDTGFVDYEVFSPLDLSAYRVVVRGVLVEDLLAGPNGSGPFRYVVRAGISGGYLDLTGNTTVSGRINLSVDPSWVESRMAAIMFVQAESLKSGQAPPPLGEVDFLTIIAVPLVVLLTGSVMAFIVVRTVTAERRARLR